MIEDELGFKFIKPTRIIKMLLSDFLGKRYGELKVQIKFSGKDFYNLFIAAKKSRFRLIYVTSSIQIIATHISHVIPNNSGFFMH